MDDDARSGIDAARKALWSALAKFVGDEQETMYAEALDSAMTGIAAIDALFPYITHEADQRAQIDARLAFLDRLVNAANEPDDVKDLRRGRSDRAKDAAEQLRKASGTLALLDNDPLSQALFDLAKIVEARAATSQITVQMNTAGIAPGLLVLAKYQMQYGSTAHASARGGIGRRTEIVRFIAQILTDDAPDSKIAALLSKVLDIKCSNADVKSALAKRCKA